MIDSRERHILRALQTAGPLSRWELHERTGQTPNRVGQIIEGLVRQRLVRERDPEPQRAGRPRVPIEIDPIGRHFIGVSIVPGQLTGCRMGLAGDVLERLDSTKSVEPQHVIRTAAGIIARAADDRTLGIAVTMTGFIDPARRSLLLSSATPGQRPTSLRALDRAAGARPLVLGNDMLGLAARWSLSQVDTGAEDVLIVWFDDGRVGASYLAGGRPCRGVLSGANELGHTRLAVETDQCFCGQIGCLERIFSSTFLTRRDASKPSTTTHNALARRLERFDPADVPLHELLGHFCTGLANAINLLRPHRVVLVTPLAPDGAFRSVVVERIRERLLSPLRDIVSIQFWNHPANQPAENAAWLAHAELLRTGWDTIIAPDGAAVEK